MDNNTTNIAPTGIGLDIDSSKFNQPKGTYNFALNAILENFDGNFPQLQNDSSNVRAVNFPSGYSIIGKAEIYELEKTIVCLVNTNTGQSEIGVVSNIPYADQSDTDLSVICGEQQCISYTEQTPLENTIQEPYCYYTTLVNDKCLNFSIDHPIDIEYRVTTCSLYLYFVDNYNDNRFIYFDFSNGALVLQDKFKKIIGFSDDDCKSPIYGNIDCNKIKFNPNIKRPQIDFVDLISGGKNAAGVYQALVAYADAAGNPMTNYMSNTNPIPIFDKELTFETNYMTDKAIVFQINNLDTTGAYRYYNIVIVQTVDNSTTLYLAATLPVTKSQFIFTGKSEQTILLTPNDVFYKKIFYNKAYSITQAGNVLYLARPSERRKLNLQRAINGVKLYWETKALKEGAYKKALNSNKYRTYQRDEVYVFGLVGEFDNGDETSVFHIPNLDASNYPSSIFTNVFNTDVIKDTSCANVERNKFWQIYNTASILSSPHQFSEDCTDNSVWETGQFAYHESGLPYPNIPEVWGDLCGKPMLFHRFPDNSISHIHDGANRDADYKQNNIIYPIGVKVDHQSVLDAFDYAVTQGLISAEERTHLVSYRIVRANREKSIIAKGMLYDMWSYDKFGNKYYYPNYGYNDLRQDNFISNDPNTYKDDNTSKPRPNSFTPTGRYTFHSPDTSFTEPSVDGVELKLETLEYGQSEGYFNHCEEQAKQRFLTTFAMTLAFGIGVAAALSATGERECTTYTVKSEYGLNDLPYPDIHQGGYDLTSGTAFPNVPAISTSRGSADAIETHNNMDFTPFGKDSGITLGQIPAAVESYTKTTCKGTTWQLLSPINSSGISAITGALNQVFYRTILGLNEMQLIVTMMKALIPLKNMSIQYNSVGKYNSYVPLANDGDRIRRIDIARYLSPNIETVDENIDVDNYVTTFINNYNRESTIYIKVGGDLLPSPIKEDNSRFTMDEAGLDYDELNKRVYRNISSYYASLKRYLPNQYGEIYRLTYLETGMPSVSLTDGVPTTIFGGDTFIGRFACKRKMPFFLQTRFMQINESDVEYTTLGNVGYPNYFFDTERPLIDRIAGNSFGGNLLGIYQDMVGVAESRLDARTNNLFYQKGYIHLYNYGIPYFICESDFNVDLRHGENIDEKDFYPHQKNLDYWLQEKHVPINQDNYYIYNTTYSKQNEENYLAIDQPTTKYEECFYDHTNRIVGSQNLALAKNIDYDPYLVFKANDYKDFDYKTGKLVTANGIESDKLFVRFENGAQLFNAFDVLTTEATQIQVGNGGIFNSRGQEFSAASLGYAGSQHKDLLRTEFGHIWVDAIRGNVFSLGVGGSGLDEIGRYGLGKWLRMNLPFVIKKDFPDIEVDNSYKDVGLILCFDRANHRLLLTKKDYKVVNKNVTYNTLLKKFQISDGKFTRTITVDDTEYFANKSWTLSYDFYTKKWISFHSFTPNFYLSFIDYFQSGLSNSIWSHGVTDKSYQVYYGKICPFIIDVATEPNTTNSVLNSIEYMCDVRRYHDNRDYSPIDSVTFNKCVVYSDRENTGLLELIAANPDNLYQSLQYPQPTMDSTKIEVYNSENIWRINDLWNSVRTGLNNVPIWFADIANANRHLNPQAINYQQNDFEKNPLRGNAFNIKLINDAWSNYKFMVYLNQFNQVKSYS